MKRALGLLIAAAVAGVSMTALLVWRYDATYANPQMRAYAQSFDHPRTHAERLIDGMDGQAFGEIALDPAMTHATARFGTAPAAAYREARPAYGWVAFVASVHGDAARVADTLLVLSVLSVAFLAAAAGMLAHQLDRPWAAGALVALLPGAVITVFAPGSADAFGCALAILGLALWLDGRHRAAIVMFSLAALSRETLLLFPLTLAAWELWSRRGALARQLAIPVAVYAAWVAIVFARIGALPTSDRGGRLGLPFAGLLHAMAHWSPLSAEVALALCGLTVVAAVRLKTPVLRLCIGAHVGLAALLGPLVWASWKDFSRVTLPLAVLGAIACWPAGHTADAFEAESEPAELIIDDGSMIGASRHSMALRTAPGG